MHDYKKLEVWKRSIQFALACMNLQDLMKRIAATSDNYLNFELRLSLIK